MSRLPTANLSDLSIVAHVLGAGLHECQQPERASPGSRFAVSTHPHLPAHSRVGRFPSSGGRFRGGVSSKPVRGDEEREDSAPRYPNVLHLTPFETSPDEDQDMAKATTHRNHLLSLLWGGWRSYSHASIRSQCPLNYGVLRMCLRRHPRSPHSGFCHLCTWCRTTRCSSGRDGLRHVLGEVRKRAMVEQTED